MFLPKGILTDAWWLNPSRKCSQERLTRGTVSSTMRRAAHPSICARCGAGAGFAAITYQSLFWDGRYKASWKREFKTLMAQGRSTKSFSRCGGLGPLGCQQRSLSLPISRGGSTTTSPCVVCGVVVRQLTNLKSFLAPLLQSEVTAPEPLCADESAPANNPHGLSIFLSRHKFILHQGKGHIKL